MSDDRLIELIVNEILASEATQQAAVPPQTASQVVAPEVISFPQHYTPRDNGAVLDNMRTNTSARIGVNKAGSRLPTSALLKLRADHAAALDSVFMDVDAELLSSLGLFTVATQCRDKNEFLTRPDLGRKLSDEAKSELTKRCTRSPRVQVYAADGLSSSAVQANIADILPVIMDGLKNEGISTGTPFYLKLGRVPAMDEVSELLDAEVTCVLLGERPGLITAESMSAYIAYRATVGMPEARRTVVSNIHKGGLYSVEAGAYIVDVIKKMLEQKASGVDLTGR